MIGYDQEENMVNWYVHCTTQLLETNITLYCTIS